MENEEELNTLKGQEEGKGEEEEENDSSSSLLTFLQEAEDLLREENQEEEEGENPHSHEVSQEDMEDDGDVF